MPDEPPFEMPGHRWDPERRRFFKIVPGGGSSSNLASSSTSGGGATGKRKKGKGKKGKGKDGQEQHVTSPESHFASTPRLPAVAQTSRQGSVFAESRTDPIALRQRVDISVNALNSVLRSQLEAAYSHLALCTARKPYHGRHPHIRALQTDPDDCLCVLYQNVFAEIDATKETTRICFMTDDIHSLTVFWRSSDRLWYGLFWSNNNRPDIMSRYMPRHPAGSRHVRHPPRSLDVPDSLRHDIHLRRRGQESWAFVETNAGPIESFRKTTAFAIAMGDHVNVQRFTSVAGSMRCDLTHEQSHSFRSDVMAVAFDASGKVLYCGTRSGKIMAWRYIAEGFGQTFDPPVDLPIEAAGSVTNLAIVSSHEMLIVRINGLVQLVDIATGRELRHYHGHVNSYSFTLALAVDKDLRLLALAGLDRRVRVWSLDSPLPLGTSTTLLPPIHHPPPRPQTGQQLSNSLHDESNTEAFIRAHPASVDQPSIRQGSTLSTIVFPGDVSVLHWHPRYRYEGRDPYEVQGLCEEHGDAYRPPAQRWKDLYVAVGEWLYHFRFP